MPSRRPIGNSGASVGPGSAERDARGGLCRFLLLVPFAERRPVPLGVEPLFLAFLKGLSLHSGKLRQARGTARPLWMAAATSTANKRD